MESGAFLFKFTFIECKVEAWLRVSICAVSDLAATFSSGPKFAISAIVGEPASFLLFAEPN